jgi:hypothetical protein
LRKAERCPRLVGFGFFVFFPSEFFRRRRLIDSLVRSSSELSTLRAIGRLLNVKRATASLAPSFATTSAAKADALRAAIKSDCRRFGDRGTVQTTPWRCRLPF